MSGAAREARGWADRFPGFDVLGQVRHWDPVTADAVLARVTPPVAVKFFTEPEESCARALLNLLTGQDGQDSEVAVPVLEMVDSRLAAGETDGWRYADMPEDGQAWRDTLAHLDADAGRRCSTSFADAPPADQKALVQAVQELKSADWHGLPADHVWSLWTRYACTAFYAHPFAWAEIGFPGPAYPRGYKNTGMSKLEPFEVRDARPTQDPVREAGLWMASGRGTSRPGCCPTTAPGPTTGCGAICGGSPTPTRSTWSSWAAARAARSCCSGWPGPGGGWRHWTRARSGTRTPTG